MVKIKKKKKISPTPSFMQHLKPSVPTGKGLGKVKIRVK
jgi:hypothetical protein